MPENSAPKEQPQQVPITPEAKAFNEEITVNVRAALKPLREKYGEMLSDLVITMSWKPEYAAKPYPRLIIDPVDPITPGNVQRPMTISELLNMGSRRLTQEVIQMLIFQRSESDKMLTEATKIEHPVIAESDDKKDTQPPKGPQLIK